MPNENDLLYQNNKGRKSFQWQVWPFCNNRCQFCFLGEANSEYIKPRQHTSLTDLSNAIDKLDYKEYNNISLIGGEFFQGQLNDPETHDLFFSVIKKIFQLYVDKKIGSMWLTCTLTRENQEHLYELLDLADVMGVYPVDGYESSGLWLCTSWDVAGRFHTDRLEQNWEHNIKTIKEKYPLVKFNTTIILQQAFIDLYLADQFKPEEFCKKFNTSIFYMQPCLTNITEMMLKDEKGKLRTKESFSDYWLKLKQDFNKNIYEFFPRRKDFVKFLTKYYIEDKHSFSKLFNIRYRSDEIHLNINSEEHDRTVSRQKDGVHPEESFPPKLPYCNHIYNYAPYVDSNHCCICDKEAIAGI